MTGSALLLDTCAILWAFGTGEIDQVAADRIEEAAQNDMVLISPISAWEIGMLAKKGRIALTKPLELWVSDVLSLPGVQLAEMGPSILIASSFLPGVTPDDPADRIIASTARSEGYTLVTRDSKLLAYAEQGHIQAIMC